MSNTIGSSSPKRFGAFVAARSGKGGTLVRRWVGCWIDLLVLGAWFLGGGWLMGHGFSGVVPQRVFAWILILGVVLYFPLFERLWGRSVGKLVTGMIVVDANGNHPTLWRVVVRTVTRIVEVNPLFIGGVPAGLIVLATQHNQRLGDLLGGTYVVPASELRAAKLRPATADRMLHLSD